MSLPDVLMCLLTHAVFYPSVPGEYAPVLFVPGVFGAVYTELYATVLANFAGYGFIVAGVDVQWPLLSDSLDYQRQDMKTLVLGGGKMVSVQAEPKELFEVLAWVILYCL